MSELTGNSKKLNLGENMVSTIAKSGKKATTSGEGTFAHSAEKRKETSSKVKRATMKLVVGRCYPVHLHTTMCVSELPKTAGRIQTAGPALRDSWAYEHIKGLGTSDGDKAVPWMRKWKSSKAYRSYEKLLTKLQSYTPAEPTLRGSQSEQVVQAAVPVAKTVAGESSNNISSLLNQLERAFNKLQDSNKSLEEENVMLKKINAKLEVQLSSASTAAAAAEGGAEAGVDPP